MSCRCIEYLYSKLLLRFIGSVRRCKLKRRDVLVEYGTDGGNSVVDEHVWMSTGLKDWCTWMPGGKAVVATGSYSVIGKLRRSWELRHKES